MFEIGTLHGSAGLLRLLKAKYRWRYFFALAKQYNNRIEKNIQMTASICKEIK